jgi:hypothetical protein
MALPVLTNVGSRDKPRWRTPSLLSFVVNTTMHPDRAALVAAVAAAMPTTDMLGLRGAHFSTRSTYQVVRQLITASEHRFNHRETIRVLDVLGDRNAFDLFTLEQWNTAPTDGTGRWEGPPGTREFIANLAGPTMWCHAAFYSLAVWRSLFPSWRNLDIKAIRLQNHNSLLLEAIEHCRQLFLVVILRQLYVAAEESTDPADFENSCLFRAMVHRNVEAVRSLISLGASTTARDTRGSTLFAVFCSRWRHMYDDYAQIGAEACLLALLNGCTSQDAFVRKGVTRTDIVVLVDRIQWVHGEDAPLVVAAHAKMRQLAEAKRWSELRSVWTAATMRLAQPEPEPAGAGTGAGAGAGAGAGSGSV